VAKQSQDVPPPAQVSRSKSEVDGKRWTTLAVPAASAYQAWLSAGYDWIERSPGSYQPVDPAGLSAIINSKRVLIKFQPFMVGSQVVAEFDVSGLGEEFGKYSECRAPELPNPVPPAPSGAF
jgi:hypothetical protein